MNASSVLLFLVVDGLLVLTPGPDWMYVIARSLDARRGRGVRLGLVAVAGICAAYVAYTVLTATGLAAAAAAVPGVLPVLRYAGAAYLLFLAVGMLRRAARSGAGAGAGAGARSKPGAAGALGANDHVHHAISGSTTPRRVAKHLKAWRSSQPAQPSAGPPTTSPSATPASPEASGEAAPTARAADASPSHTTPPAAHPSPTAQAAHASPSHTTPPATHPSPTTPAAHASPSQTAPAAIHPSAEAVRAPGVSAVAVFRQSALTGLLNPKALLLFLSLLPQFADEAAAFPVGVQLALLGLLHVLACAVGYGAVALMASRIGRRVGRSSRAGRVLPVLSAALLIAVAGVTVM